MFKVPQKFQSKVNQSYLEVKTWRVVHDHLTDQPHQEQMLYA